MENAASALKMSVAILIFIIAIASSFSLFGTAKQTADSIITMRDKQKYLEAAELDNGGILYTSSKAIQGDGTETDITTEYISGVTTKGDRVVKADDVISTLYRYSKEKYGVTIVDYSKEEVIARFDSGTESIIRQYSNIDAVELGKYEKKLELNTATAYITPNFSGLKELYEIGGNTSAKYGAPWYGDEVEIQERINKDLSGETYKYNEQEYQGKNLLDKLQKASKIVEVTNEIDESKYLDDNDNKTNLLQQYQMPTVEIIYIIY